MKILASSGALTSITAAFANFELTVISYGPRITKSLSDEFYQTLADAKKLS